MNNTALIYDFFIVRCHMIWFISLTTPLSAPPTVKCVCFFSLWGTQEKKQSRIHHLLEDRISCMFSKVSLVRPSFSTVTCVCPTIKQSKRVCLITLGKYRFLQHSSAWQVNFPRETVNVIEVSAAGIFGLEIVRAAGGATAGNGSLIFLDIERRDPLPDSPQFEKADPAGWEFCK